MRMATVVVLSLMWAGGAFGQGQGTAVLVPCLPPACLVLQPPRPAKPVSDILPGSQIVPPQLVPYTPPKFAVQPIAPPSPVSVAPFSVYVPPQPIQFVPQPMVIPQFTPDNTNNALAATIIAGQQQAQQAYANGVQLTIQRQQLQMQMGNYARRNGCTWYKQHWYSTPVCAANAPALPPPESQKQFENLSWAEKLQAARIAHPDWDEVANRPEVQAMVLQPRVMAFIKAISNGPDVFYYLATEPGAFDKMNSMSEDHQLGEVWRVSRLLREQR